MRVGQHHEARARRRARAEARRGEDGSVVQDRRVQARFLRARERELHHSPLGPGSHRERRDRGPPRLPRPAEGRPLRDRLAAAVKQSRAGYTEIRVERTWSSAVAFRGRRLETATVSEDQGGFVRVLNQGCGWGIASFTSLDELPAMVARANELSRAVRLDEPIRLADTPPEVGDAVLELDGDVRGISLSDKKQLLDRYNGAMLAVSNKIVDTQASYRDEVSEVWYVNSEGTSLYQLRPEVVVSGTAIARRNGTIEKGLESIGLRKGWDSVQGFDDRFRVVAQRAVDLLEAPRVRGGAYPVILDNELAGVFIHEAFGHLSEADFVYENPTRGRRRRTRRSSARGSSSGACTRAKRPRSWASAPPATPARSRSGIRPSCA
ncbi:MAG: hypothetical protein DMD48_03280 [Gemmatimonadetes bacterium]|nr:MAG: hypothetical protein DMD48_03280 [Gemmatimonadota bacterium]